MKVFLEGIKRRPILTAIIVVVGLVLGISLPGAVAAMTTIPGTTISSLSNIGGSGTAGQVAFFTSATDIASNFNFTWDNTNKRLGIGTATPSRLLHVKGNIALFERNVNSAGFIMERNGADVAGYNRWVFGVDEPTGFVIKTYPWDGATAVDQLVITKDNAATPENESRVGIGTTSPSARLDVGQPSSLTAIEGRNTGGGYGVYGYSNSSNGMYGESISGNGVRGFSSSGEGVYGKSTSNIGVVGESTSSAGVKGESKGSGNGVYGLSYTGNGVQGFSTSFTGVDGSSSIGIGVKGEGGSGSYDFYAGGLGTNYGPFTGAHEVKLADNFASNIRSGLIVSVTGETQLREESGQLAYSSTLPTVQLANIPNDKRVCGVLVSESPLPDDHWYKAKAGERFGIVNALGDGRVLVTNVNGNIEAGDYITTSAIAGYGQKQSDDFLHSYTLGKATEGVDWSQVSDTVELNGQTYKAYPIAVFYTSG